VIAAAVLLLRPIQLEKYCLAQREVDNVNTGWATFGEVSMKWIAMCLALATVSYSTPVMSVPSRNDNSVRLAQNDCPSPKVINAAGACACPPGTTGEACTKDTVCAAPKVINKAGACVCPAGTCESGGRCGGCPVQGEIIPGGRPCPPGAYQPVGSLNCVKCPAPNMSMTSDGMCYCPEGTKLNWWGNRCVP
jgi:hypothetical protein